MVGSSCVAQYTADDCWYRGKVVDVDFNTKMATIKFVDYGNEEQRPFQNVFRATLPVMQVSGQTPTNVTVSLNVS